MQNKISVIIPTVQKTLDVLEEILISLEADNCVEEIILINNKPETHLNFEFPKLRIITPENNLFVNPSWNLGVQEAKCNNFVLLNDDLLFGKDFCGKIVNSEIFNNTDTGLIGIAPQMIKPFSEYVEFSNSEPKFEKFDRHLGTGDWGIAIFGKKENFYEIPEDLKIIYGDNYILYKNKQAGKQNYAISNLPCRHMHSVSSGSSEFTSIVGDDITNSKKYFKELRPVEKTVVNKNEKFKVNLKGDICWITITQKETSICMKYKDGNQIFTDDILKSQLLGFKLDENIITEIIEVLIKSKNTNI